MSELLINYLKRQCELLRPIQRPSILDPSRDKVALIVEPRCHELLEAVIRNISFHLPDWNLQVVTSSAGVEFLKPKLPDWEYRLQVLPVDNLKKHSYNILFRSPEFWQETGSEEHILIFQTDSMILNQYENNRIEDYFKYPFIGARFSIGQAGNYVKTPKGIVMNGGFSLRRRSAMIRVTTEITSGRITNFRHIHKASSINTKNLLMEDVFFCHGLEILGYELPSPEKVDRFCIEDIWNGTGNIIGVHGWQYGFFNKNADRLIELAYPLDKLQG